MMMLLFVYVFGGAIETGTANYVNYLLPGILLMAIASAAYTSARLFTDRKSGLMARFITMPIKRSSVLWAHVLASLISNALTVVVVILVAFLMGFRSSTDLLDWFAVAGILGLFTPALTWLAVIPGLAKRVYGGATAYSYPLIFLPFISSALFPRKPCLKLSVRLLRTSPLPQSSMQFALSYMKALLVMISGPLLCGASASWSSHIFSPLNNLNAS